VPPQILLIEPHASVAPPEDHLELERAEQRHADVVALGNRALVGVDADPRPPAEQQLGGDGERVRRRRPSVNATSVPVSDS
jgi:hypothetical protein